jgi:hypothetical protein
MVIPGKNDDAAVVCQRAGLFLSPSFFCKHLYIARRARQTGDGETPPG